MKKSPAHCKMWRYSLTPNTNIEKSRVSLLIGSKSMFAYTDSFYIRTVYDNIEYVYIMHKNDGLPILETIYEGVKEECNGSTFIMNVESKDYDKFVEDF